MIHVLDLRNLTFLDIIYFSLHLILMHENSKLYISEVTSVLPLVINSNEKINIFMNYILFFFFPIFRGLSDVPKHIRSEGITFVLTCFQNSFSTESLRSAKET